MTKLTDYKPLQRNPNKGTQRGTGILEQSVRELGAGRSILVDKNGVILAGNHAQEAFVNAGIDDVIEIETDGKKIVVVKRTDLDADSSAGKKMAIMDNRTSEQGLAWDAVVVEDLLNEIKQDEGELDNYLSGLAEDIGVEIDNRQRLEDSRGSLQDKFIIPPFSILDARQGYWQDRKRIWLSLGLQSEVGRGDTAEDFGSGKPEDLKNSYLNNNHNSITKKRLESESKSNLTNAPKLPDWAVGNTVANMAPGTSIFDPVLCELVYRWFCVSEGSIIDPFAGGSVRGIVASKLGYKYTGVDLRQEQIDANNNQADDITPDNKPTWVTGDSQNIKQLAQGEYDLVFSCPPYYDLEVYGDDPNDLSNLDSYDDFITIYRKIILETVSMLKENRFACFVVGDIRDKKGFYRNFPSDTIQAFQDAGVTLYNEAILITAMGSLPIRVTRPFQSSRKLGKTHQNVLIFYKGDPKQIKSFGDVEVGEIDNIDTLTL